MLFRKPQRQVSRVFIHCSASDNPAHDNIETIRQWHVARGFDGVGYHYFIRKSGQVEKGRSLDLKPAAQQGNNFGTIAICCHGLRKEAFTAAQMTALEDLCSEINVAYQGTVTFHGHREVSPKTCPVFDYRAILRLDAKGHMSEV